MKKYNVYVRDIDGEEEDFLLTDVPVTYEMAVGVERAALINIDEDEYYTVIEEAKAIESK